MDLNVDDEWLNYLSGNTNDNRDAPANVKNGYVNSATLQNSINVQDNDIPEATDIYISTKSKIAHLNSPIDMQIFWDIGVMPYATPSNGVIKKQIKYNSATPEELLAAQLKLQKELYYDEQIITSINNPNGRIKFKDIRKITVGISKKDIMSYRGKKKSAFYNCFVIIIRLKIDDFYKEFHVKIFNTGKLEIPGVQNEEIFELVLLQVITTLQPFCKEPLCYNQKSDTVLINSNFNCGFYINRESLLDILKYKYNIQSIYDPCSYPGIQCKFYYNTESDNQTGVQLFEENHRSNKNILEISFMIFRTGSILIVGMCDENVLMIIYNFIKNLLKNEYKNVGQSISPTNMIVKNKQKKIRKKLITVSLII
jgi:hypothetical protein